MTEEEKKQYRKDYYEKNKAFLLKKKKEKYWNNKVIVPEKDYSYTEKVCIYCSELKDLSQYNTSTINKDGHRGMCKVCENEKSKEYYSNNLENYKEYRFNNRDKIKDHNRRYNREKKDYIKAYRFNNKHKRAEYRRSRYNTDLYFKIRCRMSNIIKASIKNGISSLDIIGLEVEEFKQYLESKWEPWMNWDNYGKYNGELNYGWDIDHIIPVSSAETEEQIIKLNHYTNLQPLCSYTNRHIKRNLIEEEKKKQYIEYE